MKLKLIDKDVLVAEIKNRRDAFHNLSNNCEKDTSAKAGFYAQAQTLEGILSFINTLEIWDIDLDSLGELARHLIAVHAHDIKPKYKDKELELLERIGYRPDKNA